MGVEGEKKTAPRTAQVQSDLGNALFSQDLSSSDSKALGLDLPQWRLFI
jgi:hypothetical protein